MFVEVKDILTSLGLILTVTVLLYLYTTRNFNVFKKAGIPGPDPLPLFGNILDMSNTNLMSLDLSMCKKYGKFVGTFIGSDPMMLVYDPKWANEAFIKHFDVFTNRKRIKLGGAIDTGILSVEGDHWRHARKTLSPVFTNAKLKQMLPLLHNCVNVFTAMLENSLGEPVDIRKMANLLTLDAISSTAFGVESKVQTTPDGEFASNAFLMTNSSEANNTLAERLRVGVVVLLNMIAPTWLQKIACKFFTLHFLNPQAAGYFEALVETVIEERRTKPSVSDLLQTLTESICEVKANSPDTLVDGVGLMWTKKGLTKDEVIGNSILFLFAGFQTTADSMMFVFYELTQHPHVEQKLYEEIMEVCDTEEITVEQVNQMKYLECCINETMRLYPQGFRFDRIASKDVTVKGVHVSKGTAVTVSPWVIHRDPEIWENPEEFDPNRFSPERFTEKCAAAFMPFGIGNRQCIGSRLALLEMKMTLIFTVKKFQIEKNILTPKRPIKFKNTVPLTPLCTEEPIIISFKKRRQ